MVRVLASRLAVIFVVPGAVAPFVLATLALRSSRSSSCRCHHRLRRLAVAVVVSLHLGLRRFVVTIIASGSSTHRVRGWFCWI